MKKINNIFDLVFASLFIFILQIIFCWIIILVLIWLDSFIDKYIQ